jgi:phosphotransferase system  glucose/maltose/N-acetylglucosamine-specific IIC component
MNGQIQAIGKAKINDVVAIIIGTKRLPATTLQTGVFGGIIIGALAAWCYNKFYNISLPSYLGFFAGKRFVPIMMAIRILPIQY